jgi:hypothetical protein
MWGALIASNNTIEELDLGYNKIAYGMAQIGDGLQANKSIKIIKLHRQAKDMGAAVEEQFVKFWTVDSNSNNPSPNTIFTLTLT